MKQRNNINRIITFALVLVLLFSHFSNAMLAVAKTKNNDSAYTSYVEFRIAVDGTVYQTKAYINQKEDVYVTSSAAKKLLGKKPSSTVKINGKTYTSLSLLTKHMFKPGYPNTIYAAKYCFGKNEPMEFDGDLVKGTTLRLYLSKVKGEGSFKVTGNGKELYSKQLSTMNYKTDSPLSRYYPYAKSDKCITITLAEKIDNLKIEYSGDYWEWSGIDVTLPKEYEVKRWWNTSGYDLFLEGKEETLSALSPKLKKTSNIMISPNSSDSGDKITIHSDVSFTSNAVREQANKDTINHWGNVVSKFAPSSLVRCEAASFCIGTDLESALSYYEDFLEMCNKNKLGWLSNSYDAIMNDEPKFISFKYGGAKSVPYDKSNLQVDLLELYQKYAIKPKAI